ncbi:hypothetical protein NQ015_04560 [Corynebacterium sp. 153RC1]|uniref:hypothetical protein n=1 Tax=unclassified Corynebacterium TaxID=2624378 RepID=UPI00211BB4F9|nr:MULTISPECIES: hypothetical protein [unclassified Corynebacterium]MCQ9370014.1 hypothetical protein [Corynebacterium sp. 35RC1]MCQ9352143.1 hypothetical protein [Corynebacterium sp. 209RC1]MCQ9354146.1 hypothetical protein [Corynebacterium sp. 1222RC1]MCQ9356426.1 hypothetical protein [Corynebacterium sp. 122RC1]MCQ9358528.1 hypothetical protein [Corynebacterium sp. 142RC1]
MAQQRKERLLVDVSTPLGSHLQEVAELVVYTGLAWAFIGYLDSGTAPAFLAATPTLRNAVVWIWVALVVLRFLLPVLSSRRRRIKVTDQRLSLRGRGIRGRKEDIPLEQILEVGRHRNTLHLVLVGWDRPYLIPNVPKAKRVQAVLSGARERAFAELAAQRYAQSHSAAALGPAGMGG